MRLDRASELLSDCTESFYSVFKANKDVPGEAKLVFAMVVEATRSFLHGISPELIPPPLQGLIRSKGVGRRGLAWHSAHRWFSYVGPPEPYTYFWAIEILNQFWDIEIDAEVFRDSLLALADIE